MRTKIILTFAFCLLVTGCRPASPPDTTSPQKPQETNTDNEKLRRALANIDSYLHDLEGSLKLSTAQSWSHEASASQHALGNIQIEVSTLKQGSQNVGTLESWLSELEGKLRGASADNWSQNASAAQHIVGNIRIELQSMGRGM